MSSLQGRLIAVSISDAPDRARLGFPQSEIDRVFLSICLNLVRHGARVLYGGNLDPEGFTFKIFRHLAGAYGTRSAEAPFVHLVPDIVLRKTEREQFEAMLQESAGTVESVMLDENDHLVPASHDVALDEDAQRSLGRMRSVSAQITAGRVVMGGKMGTLDAPGDQYAGRGPGVVEEAIATIEAKRPLAVLGAFGGAARDLAIAMDLMPENAKVARGKQQEGYQETIARARDIWRTARDGRFVAIQSTIASEENADVLANLTISFLEAAMIEDGGAPQAGMAEA